MKKTLIAATVALLATGFAHASTEADVENTFNPYKGGFPKVNGLNPGTVIVGKKSLKWLPLVGQLYWLTGSLFIDRAATGG